MNAGILNIDKPTGLTSHDVVARVRRLVPKVRVGHAGTLDPMATGVLVVCLGKATRLIEYLAGADKRYQATIRFGVTTTTWDADGEVEERRPIDGLDRAQIEAQLPRFTGAIDQVPPMYSALKRKGQPLYRLARRGVTVERAARRVEVYSLVVERWSPPDLTVRIHCSKGTYVRALAHDVGQAVGVGAHLAALRRTAVGAFTVEDAVDLEWLLARRETGAWRERLYDARVAVQHLPQATADSAATHRLTHGQPASLSVDGEGSEAAVLDPDGQLLALVRYDPESGLWRPHKVLQGA
ncbi:MAG TPA: tRNA pseudouridine(55) synthase TruB [Chloroflexi bacterium]|jgi:tRNA pseudouridine55 synthase|nr:tRNA pseudouridine(55) synthase TruB [Chloroflexota bacterium]